MNVQLMLSIQRANSHQYEHKTLFRVTLILHRDLNTKLPGFDDKRKLFVTQACISTLYLSQFSQMPHQVVCRYCFSSSTLSTNEAALKRNNLMQSLFSQSKQFKSFKKFPRKRNENMLILKANANNTTLDKMVQM